MVQWVLRGTCHKFPDNVHHIGDILPRWLITQRHTDPDFIIPHMFEAIRKGFSTRVQPGDLIVAGANFGVVPKLNGYLAMAKMGVGLLTESTPFLAYRSAIGCGVPTLDGCTGVTQLVVDGDTLEVDFRTGAFHNITRGIQAQFDPIPKELHDLVEAGGTIEYLKRHATAPA